MKNRQTIWAVAAIFLFLRAATVPGAETFDYGPFLRSLRLPPGFSIQLAAGEPAIRFPMFACFDDDGRLYVAESSGNDLYAGLKRLTRDCRIACLEDADGDGRFEKSTTFQERVTFPMGLAWREGKLYLADPPNLVALTDTNRDGRADTREVILSGFGHTDNGSLHGLTFGPDGLLYFTMGEPDGYKLPREDGSFLEGRAGALLRCRADGSHPEVICRGFVNLVEVEFMQGGEMIATDNWYQKPSAGYRDALIDCAPGGLYPFIADQGTPLPRTGLLLPPLTLLPAVAHSGLTRLRSAAFPIGWRDHLFVAEHNTRRVAAHALKRDGSTFAATNMDFVVGEHPDFHPSDVLEDADGSLLVVDTGGWYVEHCPTGRIRNSRAPGGIYRINWTQAAKINDPRGRNLPWDDVAVTELGNRLRDSRPAVAERARTLMLRRGEVKSLLAALAPEETITTRLRALWTLGQMSDPESLVATRAQLNARDPEVVTVATRALALRQDHASGNDLADLLQSTNAPTRRAAADALAVCGSPAHAPKLVTALAKASDDFEKHACIATLQALADEPFVRDLLRHDSTRVRQAALNLLDQPPLSALRFADLVQPLGASETELRATARNLLERHRNWAADALPWLRSQLAQSSSDDSKAAAVEGLLLAFQANTGIRHLISELLDPAASTSEAVRAFLLRILPSLVAKPPEPDWLTAIRSGLTNSGLRLPALAAAAAYPQPAAEPLLVSLAEDARLPAPQRLLAARAAARQPALRKGVFALALAALRAEAAAPERLSAVDLLARAHLTAEQMRQLLEVLSRGGPVAPDPLLPAFVRVADQETRPALAEFFATRLKSGWSPARVTLDKVLGLFPDDAATRASLLASWEQNNAEIVQRLNDFKPLLAGGDAGRGQKWFLTATCAGCHRVGAIGGVVGPDLTKVGAIRSGNDLLESILYPSSSFAQGYEPYSLTRRDGEELSGSLTAQGPEGVSLRDAAGTTHWVRADDIASLERHQLSAMPEGLEQLLTREQFQDLLAYLQSLR